MPHHVRIHPSGQAFPVEAGETVLDAAWRQGIQLPYGCRTGHCGACTAELRQGRVNYPDGPPPALTDPNHTVLCRAVPAGDCEFGIRVR